LQNYYSFFGCISGDYCCPWTVFQLYSPNRELAYVHLDKLIFVAGEAIRYKAYVVDLENPGQTSCSKILYFTLTGIGQIDPLVWRINFSGRPVAGSLSIPNDIKAGMYVLTAHTNWMKNDSPETFYSQKICIMNLSEDVSGTLRVIRPGSFPKKRANLVHRDFELNLNTSKDTFSTRENVRIEIALQGNSRLASDAGVSVSVYAQTPFDSLLAENDIVMNLPVIDSPANTKLHDRLNCTYRIEDRGFILKGRIISAADKSLISKCSVWLSVIDSLQPRLLYTPTDSAGEFQFYLSRNYDNRELILQLADPAKNNICKIELYSKAAKISDTASIPLLLTPETADFLLTAKNIRLIEAIYSGQQTIEQPATEDAVMNYFSKPDKIIIPADYAEMRNFREIASNIVPEVKFGVRNERFFLQVLSPANTWKDNRVVLLNGIPFTDLAYISTLGTNDIKRIDIFKDNLLIGDLTFPGLVSIYTNDLMVPENFLQTQTVRYQNSVVSSREAMTETEAGEVLPVRQPDDRYPDFRHNLYWKPFVYISKNNKAVIEFPASVLTGTFRIDVQGLTREGYPVSASSSIIITE